MEISLNFKATTQSSQQFVLIAAFSKTSGEGSKKKSSLVNTHWPPMYKEAFSAVNAANEFSGKDGETFSFILPDGTTACAWGLGDKSKLDNEKLRKQIATAFKAIKNKYSEISINLDSFLIKNNIEKSVGIIVEALSLTAYEYDKHQSKKRPAKIKTITLDSSADKKALKKAQKALDDSITIADCVKIARDFVNEPPNILNSETYAKLVEKDVKAHLKGVKIKILDKAALKKEKMGLFLSVNAGSAYGPRLVHLTYTPKKVTKKTKHIALVGKGLTFDTGGYSIKPSTSMVNMKFDMAGSSTVYGAFRAAVLLGADVQISCFLGMTDNAINAKATMPDSICTARNGKTVEILNTDAEGRLVLADVLDYACSQNPDVVIDSATLTGACLVALGTEVCGLMGNDKKLASSLLSSAKATDEYMWQLPIIEEWRKDMKSNIADLKNIGASRFGGTAKAAAFLEEFVHEGVAWAHLDIAGCGDSQSHLPYCPAKGGSGLIVRTLAHYLTNA